MPAAIVTEPTLSEQLTAALARIRELETANPAAANVASLTERLAASEAEVSNLRAKLAAAESQNAELTARAASAEAPTVANEHAEQVAALNRELASAREEVTRARARVASEVARLMAEVGCTPPVKAEAPTHSGKHSAPTSYTEQVAQRKSDGPLPRAD